MDGAEIVDGGGASLMLGLTEAIYLSRSTAADRSPCQAHARLRLHQLLLRRFGKDVVYHCEYADEETLDQLEAKKDKVFVVPTIGSPWAYTYEAEPWGITKEIAERNGMLERACDAYRKMRKRGIRALPGGDYGFGWNPIGNNARPRTFRQAFRLPARGSAARCDQYRGELMGMGNELGLIKESYLADIRLVNRDVVADVTLLQDRNNLLMIMKDGNSHKPPEPRCHQSQVAAE